MTLIITFTSSKILDNSNNEKLFLTASFCDVAQYLNDFFEGNLKGKTGTFIPTARVVEEYTGYLKDDVFEVKGNLF